MYSLCPHSHRENLTGIERAHDICLCFGRCGSRGLLLNLMPSYCIFRFTYHRSLQSYPLRNSLKIVVGDTKRDVLLFMTLL